MFVFVALPSIFRCQSLILLLELTDMFLQQMYLLTADTRLAQCLELIDAFMKFHVLMFDERHAIVELANLRFVGRRILQFALQA